MEGLARPGVFSVSTSGRFHRAPGAFLDRWLSVLKTRAETAGLDRRDGLVTESWTKSNVDHIEYLLQKSSGDLSNEC